VGPVELRHYVSRKAPGHTTYLRLSEKARTETNSFPSDIHVTRPKPTRLAFGQASAELCNPSLNEVQKQRRAHTARARDPG